jgi:hypothetical protein
MLTVWSAVSGFTEPSLEFRAWFPRVGGSFEALRCAFGEALQEPDQ